MYHVRQVYRIAREQHPFIRGIFALISREGPYAEFVRVCFDRLKHSRQGLQRRVPAVKQYLRRRRDIRFAADFA